MQADALRSNYFLLRTRLFLYSAAFLHLTTVALVLLNLDLSSDKDPEIRAYTIIRWRLLTIWSNLIALLYFPICIYCDWMEKNGCWDDKRVWKLRQIRDVILTSILLPTTLFCDLMFWRIWHKDRAIIAPLGIFDYLPHWTHHSLHSISGVVVSLDLLMVPRRKPASLLPRAAILTIFTTVYLVVVAASYANGIVIYGVLNLFDKFQIILLTVMSYLELFFYYTLQWCVVDTLWGNRISEIDNKVH